jgi:hypothetical protein
MDRRDAATYYGFGSVVDDSAASYGPTRFCYSLPRPDQHPDAFSTPTWRRKPGTGLTASSRQHVIKCKMYNVNYFKIIKYYILFHHKTC